MGISASECIETRIIREIAQPTGRACGAPFFFSGPTRTLVAPEGSLTPIGSAAVSRTELADSVEAALEAKPGSYLVGAVPFHDDEAASLFLAHPVQRLGRWWPRRGTATLDRSRTATPCVPADDAVFTAAVRATVDRIRRGDMKKAVLSRARDVQLSRQPDLDAVLLRLRRTNPHGFVFSLRLPHGAEGGESTFVGASPELLVSRRGRLLVTNPLAGSIPRSEDVVLDRCRAEALRRSPKDLEEHRFVVEQVLEDLAPVTTELSVEPAPRVIATPTMWHLSTRISGLLRPGVTALRLALSLHPTPAVCGVPRDVASAWIRHSEPFRRGLFTGALGYMDGSGDGDFVVSIRCAEVSGTRARLYAGAGIVAGSDAEAELVETESKMATMLSAFEAVDAPAGGKLQ